MKSSLVVACLLLISQAIAIRFNVWADSEFCIADDFRPDELVVGTIKVEPIIPGMRLEMKIYDVEENVIFNDNDVAGQTKFAFSTHMDEEEYLFCFNDVSGGHQTNPRTVILDYEVKNDESEQAQQDILQKQNLDPLEVKARLLEMKAKDISGDYEYSREREHTHRDTNESTNERTTWMMAASLGLLAALAIGQHFYLKRYFKSHKVI